MINFTCKCGHQFSAPEDMAGGFVQCPDCRLLVDVPYLSDLANIEADGTFKLGPEVEPDPLAYQKMARAFGARRDDDDDDIYDLRPTPEDIMNAGVEEIPPELKDQLRPGAPKYDPETGELIRPLDLKPHETPPPQDIPLAKPALSYARGEHLEGARSWSAPLALLLPGNVAVLAIVFLMHLLNQIFVIAMAGGMFFIAPLPILVLLVIMAHYANIIDEVGRQERDELPGPLRGMSWGEDIWHPFVSVAGALIICFFPALWTRDLAPPLGPIVSLSLLALGAVFFPAILLTTAASGSAFNLRPDRVFGVIRVCGLSYLRAILLGILAIGLYAVALAAITRHAASMVQWGPVSLPIRPLVAYPLLMAAIYLMHMFTWNLGLLYRKHQPNFPWILQHHEWSFKTEKELQALRRQRARRPIRKPPTPSQPATTTQSSVSQPTADLPPIPLEPASGEPIPLEPLPPTPVQPLPVQSAESEAPSVQPNRLANAQAHLLKAMQRDEQRHTAQNLQNSKNNPPTAAGFR